MLGRDLLPELGADLVAALADAERDDLLHFCVGGTLRLARARRSPKVLGLLVRRFVERWLPATGAAEGFKNTQSSNEAIHTGELALPRKMAAFLVCYRPLARIF